MSSTLPNQTTVPGAPIDAMSANARRNSYGQILKSSALIGGSSVLTIGIGVIRTKAMALLLGPAGFGLTGLYLSILDLARGFAAMGINTSGVRQIAAAVGTGDQKKIARTVTVLRRTSVVLGLVGALALALFARPIARFTFDTDQYASAVRLLSIAVLFYTMGGGMDALIQGMRRIGDLARIGVFGAALGVVTSVPIVYFLRERGIAPALVSVAAMSVLLSWWFSRRVQVEPVSMSAAEIRTEAGDLLKLGFAFLGSSLLTMGAAYAIRVIILRHFGAESAEAGKEAAGYYQSAWALGGMYVAIILQAMGADFYPRLTGSAEDNAECNHLVNEQAQVSLLLAGPGVLGTLTFAPLVIAIFYSTKFADAVPLLRWICLGMALRVVIWPVGFIVVAKGRQLIFFAIELLATAMHLGLAVVGVRYFGLNGAGMAFLGLYLVHCCVVYLVVRRMSGFRWSASNMRIALVMLSLIVGVFCGFQILGFWVAMAVGVAALAFSTVYSLRTLVRLVPAEKIPRPVLRVLGWIKLSPTAGH